MIEIYTDISSYNKTDIFFIKDTCTFVSLFLFCESRALHSMFVLN